MEGGDELLGECLGDCLGECCCCMCLLCVETDCCGACSRSRPTNWCCVVTAALSAAVAVAAVLVVAAYAGGVFPARVSVEDASLGRLALADDVGTNGTGTAALAYNVSLAVAVRGRNFATGGVWRAAPLHAELRFRGRTFARATAPLESAEWGRLFPARGKGLYRVAADSGGGGAPVAVALGGDDGVVAEFVRESVAGVFELELAVVVVAGGSSVSATCPLKLSLPTATAPVAFTGVKCT